MRSLNVKKTLLGLVVLIVFVGSFLIVKSISTPSQLNAKYFYYTYRDEKSFVKASDIIVVGTVNKVSKENFKIKSNPDSLTKFEVTYLKIDEVLKGDVKAGDTISFMQENDIKHYKDEHRGVFFLRKLAGYPENFPYGRFNPDQTTSADSPAAGFCKRRMHGEIG